MDAIGTAHRVTIYEAKRAFMAGEAVLVSEYGHELVRHVYRDTTTHTRDTTNWDELVADVNMWRNRYPNQRYYIVTRCMAQFDPNAVIGACSSQTVKVWHGYAEPAIACGRHADENIQSVFNGHRIQMERDNVRNQ